MVTLSHNRLFDPVSLEYIATIPKPHPLGVDIATALDARYTHQIIYKMYHVTYSSQFTGDGDKYADTVALAIDVVSKRVRVYSVCIVLRIIKRLLY